MDIAALAAVGMRLDEQRVNVISQNIANVTTPGYKALVSTTPALSGHFASMLDGAFDVPGGTTAIDPKSGALRQSGLASDIAIEGNAFLELIGPDGPVYTRQGSLHVDARGRLVGAQGLPVAGMGGEIVLANAPFTISSRGDVMQGGRSTGLLKLVTFDRPSGLQSLGNGTYAQGTARASEKGEVSTVRSGFTEASNVSSAQEMVRLSETVRHFEALHKLVQGYDESLEKTIRKLGEF
jgi:flagellar basal body rod protein FlgG